MVELREKWLMPLSLTLILIGYLGVWMPGDVAGLRLIGWEVGSGLSFCQRLSKRHFRPIYPPQQTAIGFTFRRLRWR